jgi:hypothetical protein
MDQYRAELVAMIAERTRIAHTIRVASDYVSFTNGLIQALSLLDQVHSIRTAPDEGPAHNAECQECGTTWYIDPELESDQDFMLDPFWWMLTCESCGSCDVEYSPEG